MAMMKIAAGFAVACVARAAGPEPVLAEGKALLQMATHGSQRKGSAGATDLMYTQVKTMASDIAASRRAMSGTEQEWLDSIVSYVQNTSTPAINQGHKDDQILMDNAVSGLVACETTLESDTVSVNGMKAFSDEKDIEQEGCRADESVKEAATSAAWSELSNVYVGISAPAAPSFSFDVSGDYLAQAEEFEKVMNAFVAESEAFAEGLETSYKTALKTYQDAETAREEKQKLCNQSQVEFESGYCQWHAGAESVLDKHEDCWETGSESFNLVKATVLDAAEQRKHEFMAVQKILCFVQMLKEAVDQSVVTGSAQTRAGECEGLVVDTSGLDLVNTGMPSQSAPHFGDLTLKPGDAAWAQQQYGAFASNAPAAPVMACAGASTATQGPDSLYTLY